MPVWFWIILGVILVICLLYLLALRCRGSHERMEEFLDHRYAHRGLHDEMKVPENSLSAFRLALRYGYGAELDVHLMKDGNLAVIHDSSLLRMTGADIRVEDLTLEDMNEYHLADTEEPIPLLNEVLPLFEGKTPLIIELKSEGDNAEALAQAAVELLDRYDDVTYCIESFDPRCLRWLKKNRPEIIRGQLSQNMFKRRVEGISWPVKFLLTHLLTNFLTVPDFIAYHCYDRRNLSLKIARGLYGAEEFTWTVRTRQRMRAAERDGCTVIFERFHPDQPELD